MSSRILAQGEYISNDTRTTGLNNNDLIIGPSGSGKTRGYVIPNILQGGESLIVTDTKGGLCRNLGGALARQGYAVREVNLCDCMRSATGYNPLDHIRFDAGRGCHDEQDIIRAATVIVPVEDHHAPFWDMAARMVLECLIGYVLEYLPENERNLSSVVRLLGEMSTGNFFRLLNELAQVDPDGFAVDRYKMFLGMASAEKMYASIQGILAEKLSPLTFAGAKALYGHRQRINFEDLGRRKTAVFLTISDTDRSLDKLATLFYSQALQALCREADRSPGQRLKVPVRFILDDFAAAADSCIPDFDKIISVIRSREISVSVILQSLSQLEASYGHGRAMTIINNCDHFLYLGGQDVETARYVSVKANKSVNTILQMPLDGAWLFRRGAGPKPVNKYSPEQHPLYAQIGKGPAVPPPPVFAPEVA